jgi:hypothetical protein
VTVLVPDASVPLTDASGKISKDWYPVLQLLVSQANTATADLEDGDTGLGSKATLEQEDAFYGVILVPQDQAYKLVVKLAYGLTITETTTVCSSGTCTATFAINATPLGGTANSVSSSEESQEHASANEAEEGDDLTVTISSNSSCLNLSLNIKFTYALA